MYTYPTKENIEMTHTKVLRMTTFHNIINNVLFECSNIPTRYMCHFYNQEKANNVFNAWKIKTPGVNTPTYF